MSSLDELPVMRFAAAGGGAVVKFVKLVLLGGSSDCKSNLMSDIVDVDFVSAPIERIARDFKTRAVSIDGLAYKLQVWDPSGQERFRGITTSYLKGAKGFCLVFDYNKRDSFECIEMWNNYILEHTREVLKLQQL